MTQGRSIPFRSWFYFRTGYAQYFVFIFGVLNTLTLTYYLAIDNYPALVAMFPSFTHYIAISVAVGLPVLIVLGYIHMRRSSAYRSEVEVSVETDPYMYRLPPGLHREVYAPFFYDMLAILKKSDAGEKMSEEDLNRIKELDKKLGFLTGGGTLDKPKSFEGL